MFRWALGILALLAALFALYYIVRGTLGLVVA